LPVTGRSLTGPVNKRAFEPVILIAAQQRGLFSLAQAQDAGLHPDQVIWAEKRGKLRRVRRGVYAVAGVPPSPWEPIVGAALAAGPGCVVSHWSAACVHGFEFAEFGPPEVTVVDGTDPRPSGVVVHHRGDLSAADIVSKRGLRVTSPSRALVDLAGQLGPARTEKLLDEGLIRRRWTCAEIEASLERARRNLPGRGHLTGLLRLRSEGPLADSVLEASAFRALVAVPPYIAHFQVVVDGATYVLDGAWPERMVGVEIVGRAHRVASRSAFDRERRKLNALTRAGWRIVHLTATMSDADMVDAVRALL